jgi:hypothetical protein
MAYVSSECQRNCDIPYSAPPAAKMLARSRLLAAQSQGLSFTIFHARIEEEGEGATLAWKQGYTDYSITGLPGAAFSKTRHYQFCFRVWIPK